MYILSIIYGTISTVKERRKTMNYKPQIVHQIEWKIDYLKEHHDRCAYDRLIGFLDCALLASVITVDEYNMYYDTAMSIYYDMD